MENYHVFLQNLKRVNALHELLISYNSAFSISAIHPDYDKDGKERWLVELECPIDICKSLDDKAIENAYGFIKYKGGC